MWNRFRGACCLMLLMIVTGAVGGCSIFPLEETTVTVHHEHVTGSGLVVESANGSISVKTSDRADVKIVARIRAVSKERLDAATVVAVRADDGTLTVRVEWPDGQRHGREGCSFEIEIPDAVNVRLKSSNGRLLSAGLGGKADLKTSNGSIDIKNHSGPIEAKSSNGKILIDNASDSIQAQTSNGAIRVSLSKDSKGPVNLKTSNGSVTLGLGPAFLGNLALKTSNGSIKLDDLGYGRVVSHGKKQAVLEFGDGGQDSTVRTSNGTIRVRSNSE